MDYNYTPLQDHSYKDNNKPKMEISSNLKEKMPKIKICPVPDDGKVLFLNNYINKNIK